MEQRQLHILGRQVTADARKSGESAVYPVGAAITSTDFYVDDVLTGFDTILDSIEGQAQLTNLFFPAVSI